MENTQNVTKEAIDLEAFAREGKQVPKAARYQIRVDKQKFIVDSPIKGQAILDLVTKSSNEYRLYEHFHGGQSKVVQPQDDVDLTAPGVERFTTMKIENSEGSDGA